MNAWQEDLDTVLAESPDYDEPPAFKRSWQPVDLTGVLEGSWQPPEPTVGRRSDGVGLFYPSKLHTVSSESEGGKTWFMLAAVLEELDRFNHVVYLDFEDDEGGIVGRLLTLGASPQGIAARFHYVRPEDAIGAGIHSDDLGALLGDTKPTLAVVDGVTEAMTMHALSPNDNTDVAKFGRLLPRRLAASGAAAVCIDHVTKSGETRGRYSIGAVHKLNGLDGAAYVLENRTSFGVGLTGRSTIKIAKDRPGQLRKHALPSAGGMHWMGDLVLTSDPAGFSEIEVAAPETSTTTEFRPTRQMAAICQALADHDKPLSGAQLEARVVGKATTIRQARSLLEVDGYITDKSPYSLLKPFDGVTTIE